MSANYQDWTPVVLRKNTPVIKEKIPVANVNPVNANKQVQNSVNVRKLEEDEDYKIPSVTREMGIQIQQARMSKKLTQVQLAQKCNIPDAIIKEYERGQGIYNRTYLDPICRILGIKINKTQTHKNESR